MTALALSNAHSLMSMPLHAGTLDQYIQSAQRIPMLSEHEEADLTRRMHENGDIQAAQKLVLSHLRLVIAIARGYLGYGLPHADLIQEGNIGLMKAVRRFDLSHGARLATFALHHIKAEIHEYIVRNWRLVKVATTKAQRKLFFNLRALKGMKSTLDPNDVQAISETLNVLPEEVREMEVRLSGREVGFEREDEEDDFAPIDYLRAEDADPAVLIENLDYQAKREEGMKKVLDSLDARSRDIIVRRWMSETPATLHELAAEYGVSAERIRQIEAKAMKTMREALNAFQVSM